MHNLTVMIKPSSGNCNMSCDYCFYRDEIAHRSKQDYGFMNENTLKNVIQKTMSGAEHYIFYSFQGGEPTLLDIDFYKRALALQKQYNHNHIHVYNAFQTNGYMLNDDWCRFFRENNILVGISLDGTKNIHDLYRHTKDFSHGTYDRIYENIKTLEKYEVEYNILTVVTKQAAENISEIYHMYQKHGWNYQQYIDCLDSIDENSPTHVYSLDPDTFGNYMTKLFNLWFKDLMQGNQPYIRKFENYVAILAGMQPESCEQMGECGIQLVVEADGSTYPCDFYMRDGYLLGNFNTNTLQDMDIMRREIGFIKRSRELAPSCRKCRYHHICRGGCQRNRIFFSNDASYHNRLCKGYRYFFDNCYDKLLHIANTLPSY